MALRLISEGAEAQILETELLGMPAVVKRRIRKAYRVKQLDDSIRSTRTRAEAKLLALATANGVNAPRVLLVDGFDLYMTKLSGKRPAKLSAPQASEVGRLLASLHELNIAHGDFTPANMLIYRSSIQIIDFGLAEMTRSLEEKALDLLLMKRSLSSNAAKAFVVSYKRASKNSYEIINRLLEIEKRGRYQTRTLE